VGRPGLPDRSPGKYPAGLRRIPAAEEGPAPLPV